MVPHTGFLPRASGCIFRPLPSRRIGRAFPSQPAVGILSAIVLWPTSAIGFQGMALSPYTLPIALTLIVMTGAVAAWALLREFSSIRKRLEAAESKARTIETVGQNVMAAVKPIELALKDLNSRVVVLEDRTEANDQLLSELMSSVAQQQSTLDQKAMALAELDLRVGEQLATITRQLSTSETMIERETTLNAEQSEAIGNIDAKLSVTENRIAALVRRIELGENKRAELSMVIAFMPDSIARLTSASEHTADTLRNLDRDLAIIRSKLAEVEAQSAQAVVDVAVQEDHKETNESASTGATGTDGVDPAAGEHGSETGV
jgi:chromosome segregation ATPase